MFPLKQHNQGFKFTAAGFGSKCRLDDRESAGLRGMYLNAVDAGQGRADSYEDKTGCNVLVELQTNEIKTVGTSSGILY